MTDSCIFCRIVAGELPAERLYEDEDVIAFRDIQPVAPIHILVIPRQHIGGPADLDEANAPLVGRMFVAASRIAAQEGFAEFGYRLVMNLGADGGQTVYHLHLHILAGRHMGWPPG